MGQLNKKISELITASQLKDEDYIPIVQDGINKKVRGSIVLNGGHSHNNKIELDKIILGDKAKWDAKSNFDGDYNSLANKPTIPIVDVNKNYVDTALNNKVDKVAGKSLIADTEITRLAGIGNYTHPATHSPSVIAQDATNRFVTDAEKSVWNGKADKSYTDSQLADKATIPKSYSTNNNGWIKNEDTGLIMQEISVLTGGINANATLDVTITFPRSFPTQVFSPSITVYNNVADPNCFVQYSVVSTSLLNAVIRVKPSAYTNGVYIALKINGK